MLLLYVKYMENLNKHRQDTYVVVDVENVGLKLPHNHEEQIQKSLL